MTSAMSVSDFEWLVTWSLLANEPRRVSRVDHQGLERHLSAAADHYRFCLQGFARNRDAL